MSNTPIHALGSDGVESNPVERGAWVLPHLLHTPPPPAPANVPQLSRVDPKLTKRQKFAVHQEEAQCTSCHRKIDPIGFGLEDFMPLVIGEIPKVVKGSEDRHFRQVPLRAEVRRLL